MTSDDAQILAIEALGWIAGSDDLMPVFLGSTGASPGDLKDQASDPAFLGAVLDFVMMNDAWVMAFCDGHGHDYEAPIRARATLPGGDLPHWT